MFSTVKGEERDAMPLPLVIRKLVSPVEVKLVLSAFSEETRRLRKSPQHLLGARLGADLVAPQVREDVSVGSIRPNEKYTKESRRES
jgi:hypothetical protein